MSQRAAVCSNLPYEFGNVRLAARIPIFPADGRISLEVSQSAVVCSILPYKFDGERISLEVSQRAAVCSNLQDKFGSVRLAAVIPKNTNKYQ